MTLIPNTDQPDERRVTEALEAIAMNSDKVVDGIDYLISEHAKMANILAKIEAKTK